MFCQKILKYLIAIESVLGFRRLKSMEKGDSQACHEVSGVLLGLLLVSTILISVPILNYTAHLIQTSNSVNANSSVYSSDLRGGLNWGSKDSEVQYRSLLSPREGDIRDESVSTFTYVPSDIAPFGTPHAPIYIDNNSDFETQNWPGEGSLETPYIIAGLEINATTGVPAINITGTNVHFIIQDCWLTSNESSVIMLISVSHAQIKNNTIINSNQGVVVLHSTDLALYENYFYSFSVAGVALHNSSSSVISNNHVENSYICIEIEGESSFNEITDNNCTLFIGGVVVWNDADSNVVSSNNCSGMYSGEVGIYIDASDYCEVSLNRCNRSQYNIVLEVSNHTDVSNNICYDATDMSLAIWGSHFINIEGNILVLGLTGIDVVDSTFITIVDNTSYNFTLGPTTGIHLDTVYNSTVEGNDLRYNTVGIDAEEFEGIITHNILEENTICGLFVTGSTELNVTWNIFVDNGLNAEDDGLHTYIDYNYWSNYTGSDTNADGIGNIWHPIDGTAKNNDTHPLMYYPTLPSWMNEPTDQDSEYGERFQYLLDIVIPPNAAPISEWWINDSHFVIDAGLISNESSLDIGEYQLEVRAYNLYGFYLSGIFTITVADTIAPVITGPDDFSFPSDSTGYSVRWHATDAGPVSYFVSLDGVIIRSRAWNASNEEVSVLCDGLDVGQHTYVITFTDIGGNSGSDTVNVTVALSPAQIFGPIVGLAIGCTSIVAVIAALYIVRKKRVSSK
jgi:nitrous oxidase accessory protein NosD